MYRYLAEPRNILAEPLGSAEPRLKNTDLHRQKTEFPTIVKLFFNQSQCRRLVALIPGLIHPRFSFVTSFIVVHSNRNSELKISEFKGSFIFIHFHSFIVVQRKSQMNGNRYTEHELSKFKTIFFILYIRLHSFSFVIFIFTLLYSSPRVKCKHFIMYLFEFLHTVQI
jgi:hypothetical protein